MERREREEEPSWKEEEAWQECVDNFGSSDEGAGSCTEAVASVCCFAELSTNTACLSDENFLAFTECYAGAGCVPLACGGAESEPASTGGSGAGRLSSPLKVVTDGARPTAAAVAMVLVFCASLFAGVYT